tara:strand:- start:3939 stop:5072 length:1134 start_codon:yes stop_codon:yes gene_type:complete
MANLNTSLNKSFDIIIVGAGAAGIGISILLQKLNLNYLILEKNTVGSSFKKWPKETKFISPSFTGNFFNAPDLNAITPDTSPAFDLLTEHPTGNEYAHYLEIVSKHFQLNIETNVDVKSILKQNDSFRIETNDKTYSSKYVIWAAGEYQYPKSDSFIGGHLCTHYSEVNSFDDIIGKNSVVIGAYESGFDAAINLVNSGKQVSLLDNFQYLEFIESDSSYSLSPFTRDRLKDVFENIDYNPDTRVTKVEYINAKYQVTTNDGQVITSDDEPINCTGFDTSLKLVEKLFEFEDDYPILTQCDESTKTPNLFLVGPQVRHGTALFCFIYKYRQRFAIVAEELAKRNNLIEEDIEETLNDYKNNNFYLSDLSCCDDECIC